MNNKMLKVIVIALAVVIVVLIGVLVSVPSVKGPTIEETKALVSSDGKLTVTAPLPGGLVASPATFAGSVTGGGWFFEASFPVKVLDGDGAVLGQGQAQATSDWMTTGTVPFSAAITFAAPKYATGTVVFAKDNPSGMPENDLELRVPVRFK